MGFSWHQFSFHRSERTEPVSRGLKARATLAWGAPGHNGQNPSGLKARAILAWGSAPGAEGPRSRLLRFTSNQANT